jgi:hypothetical protein
VVGSSTTQYSPNVDIIPDAWHLHSDLAGPLEETWALHHRGNISLPLPSH